MESEVAQIPLWQQAWAWFEANKKQALWGAGALLAVCLVVSFVLYRRSEAEVASSEALSNVSVPQLTGGTPGNVADAFLKVAATYPNSRAGARALLFAAGSFYVDGKYPEAKAQFERFTREYSDSPLLAEALLGIAACLDAQGKSAEAITAYKDVVDRHPLDQVLPQARFALGRLYEAQNKPELARNMFEEVERNNPYGSIGSEAGMRLEELKLKYPNLAAPIAAASPAPGALAPAPAKTTAPATPTAKPATAPGTNAAPLQPVKH
jgi:tetratricopeptide (TPR) repeat protein